MISHLGRYEIIEELGRGAMGLVYKARDPLIERYVAVKTINLEALSPDQRQQFEGRFYQEAKAAGHLTHPSIVTIHDLGESGDIAYIAMELMEGRELQQLLDSGKPISVENVLDLAIQIASGLAYAHQRGIVHRDIKPSNIMVLGDNHAKIVDFGIAKMPSQLSRTREGVIIGSPLYMSPEQVESKTIDARSDIYSLGVVLYQMLTRRLPFEAEDAMSLMYKIVNQSPEKPSAYNDQIGRMLEGLILKCLEKNAADRYQDARDLLQDLTRCRDELVRVRMGMVDPYTDTSRFKSLRKLATPGAIPEGSVLLVGYLVMVLTFVIDVFTDSRNASVQMHLIYLFPMALIAFHVQHINTLRVAVAVSILLQIGILVIEPLPLYARFAVAALFVPSDLFVVYVSRIARLNFIEVSKLAAYDGLTHLRNRLSFESILETELSKLARKASNVSLVIIDLDNFKTLNDARGYLAGDNALRHIAAVIREHLRSEDTAGRIGGDEFAILLPSTDAKDCAAFCERLNVSIKERMARESMPVTASIGCSTFDHMPGSVSEIFLQAEKAMLEVQARGKLG